MNFPMSPSPAFFSPPSGPANGSSNGLHTKSISLAIKMHPIVNFSRVSIVPLAAAALACVCFPCVACAADTLRVGPHERFQTIASAVKAAAPGQVIELTSGSYAEAVAINQRVVVRGVDTGGGLPVVTPAEGKSAFHLTGGGGAVIENVAIAGSEAPVEEVSIPELVRTDAGILIESNGNEIKNVTVRRMHHGMVVFGDSNRILDNDITENAVIGVAILSGRANSVSGNVMQKNGAHGLYLGWLNDPAMATGDLKKYAQAMKKFRPVEETAVRKNRMVENGLTGLVLGGAANRNTVVGNVANSNGGRLKGSKKNWLKGAGILLSCGPIANLVAENEVHANDNVGINVDPGTDNVFRSNSVAKNTSIGINVSASTGNRFVENVVTDQPDYGIALKRWSDTQLPTSGNLLTGNDLKRNGTNAFDDSGLPFEPPAHLKFANEQSKRKMIEKYRNQAANRWDDGARGNHHDDFDEAAEGFVDENGDGIGERPHPIPGGKAVDRPPLTTDALPQKPAADSEVP